MTRQDKADIKELLYYSWKDEQRNWEECDCPKKGHIFLQLRRLAKTFAPELLKEEV